MYAVVQMTMFGHFIYIFFEILLFEIPIYFLIPCEKIFLRFFSVFCFFHILRRQRLFPATSGLAFPAAAWQKVQLIDMAIIRKRMLLLLGYKLYNLKN